MYGAHYWAKPTWASILSSYSHVEGLYRNYSVAFFVFVAIVAAAIFRDRRLQTSKAQPIDGFSLPEVALSLGFLVLPVLLVILTMTQQSGTQKDTLGRSSLGLYSLLSLYFGEAP